MILNIFQDNAFFLQSAIKCFNAADIPSEYAVFSKKAFGKQLHNEKDNVFYYKISTEEYNNFIKTIPDKNYKLILFHSLFDTNAYVAKQIIKKNKNHPPLAWYIYGSEIDNAFLFPGRYFGKLTKKIYYKQKPYRIIIPFQRIIKRICGNDLKNVINNIDYFVHFIPEEIKFAEKELGIKKTSLWFIYDWLEDIIGKDFLNEKVEKNESILIGNSSSYNLNTMEVFSFLSKAKINKKILVPLSYGNKLYRNYILKKGRSLFNSNFSPLLELMPLSEYNKFLASCSFLIINSYKQQALGNINFAALYGAKVFLNDYTSTYIYLKKIGVKIFSIQDLQNNLNDELFTALSDEEANSNRKILMDALGKEKVIKMIKESFADFI